MSYTWEELAESQDFEHGQMFIELESYKELQAEIKELEAKIENKDYILYLWRQFVDSEYSEGKTLDAYSETLAELSEKGK
jgi:hypothetical protein